MSPFTDWATVPLVCDKKLTAQVLGISTRSIDRMLKAGTMVPQPMPSDTNRLLWSKAALKQYLDGGYTKYARSRRVA